MPNYGTEADKKSAGMKRAKELAYRFVSFPSGYRERKSQGYTTLRLSRAFPESEEALGTPVAHLRVRTEGLDGGLRDGNFAKQLRG